MVTSALAGVTVTGYRYIPRVVRATYPRPKSIYRRVRILRRTFEVPKYVVPGPTANDFRWYNGSAASSPTISHDVIARFVIQTTETGEQTRRRSFSRPTSYNLRKNKNTIRSCTRTSAIVDIVVYVKRVYRITNFGFSFRRRTEMIGSPADRSMVY